MSETITQNQRAGAVGEVTRLLDQWRQGEPDALHRLVAKVYLELKILAMAQLKHDGPCHTLQPTALIHETYLRFATGKVIPFENRTHFYWFAGILMRRVIVEYARNRKALKRGGGRLAISFDEMLLPGGPECDPDALLAFEEAVIRLEAIDQRLGHIVDLRFFAGLEVKEIGEALNISTATVKREWRFAKHWLAKELS